MALNIPVNPRTDLCRRCAVVVTGKNLAGYYPETWETKDGKEIRLPEGKECTNCNSGNKVR